MNDIKMIPIGDLEHHPENPRKDLGDLEELTASVKANGILQNLTVVPDLQKCKYLVVIGNRRFEAAKAAGLVELPCVISDMDHKAQVATMLEENMQRQDLTVYEQAEGFQMMMDLGYTEKEIGEKTGFSSKTVKDRLKLTKLNKKGFAEAVSQGATIMDLVEITKLDKKADQNELLKVAGTANFRQRLMDKIKSQEFEKNRARLEPVVKEYMKEVPSDERYSAKWITLYNDDFKMTGSEEDLRKHIEKVMKKEKDVPFVYEINMYRDGGSIQFRHGKPKKEMTEGEKSERQKAMIRNRHIREVKGYWAQAYELRKEFVKNYTVAKGQSASTIGKIIVKYALDSAPYWNGTLSDNHKWDDAYIRDVLGLPDKPIENPNQDPDTPSYRRKYLTIWNQVDGKSDIPIVRVIIGWAIGGGVFWPDAPEHGLWKWDDGTYDKNSNNDNGVTNLYEFLMEIGYQLSDMEKQLLDGTHECYQMEAL